jgi:hypothetical protein
MTRFEKEKGIPIKQVAGNLTGRAAIEYIQAQGGMFEKDES